MCASPSSEVAIHGRYDKASLAVALGSDTRGVCRARAMKWSAGFAYCSTGEPIFVKWSSHRSAAPAYMMSPSLRSKRSVKRLRRHGETRVCECVAMLGAAADEPGAAAGRRWGRRSAHLKIFAWG